jgi:hypothetical protein
MVSRSKKKNVNVKKGLKDVDHGEMAYSLSIKDKYGYHQKGNDL